MDKCREDLEAKFANSPELKEGHITWCDLSHSYVAKTEDFKESADYWNQILNAWRLRQPDIDLLEAKVEELQRRNQMLNDNIKEQGQKLVYQNEVIETQAEKLLGLRDEKAELQKQIDALEKSYFVLARIKSIASKNLLESILIKEVRQALRGRYENRNRLVIRLAHYCWNLCFYSSSEELIRGCHNE